MKQNSGLFIRICKKELVSKWIYSIVSSFNLKIASKRTKFGWRSHLEKPLGIAVFYLVACGYIERAIILTRRVWSVWRSGGGGYTCCSRQITSRGPTRVPPLMRCTFPLGLRYQLTVAWATTNQQPRYFWAFNSNVLSPYLGNGHR